MQLSDPYPVDDAPTVRFRRPGPLPRPEPNDPTLPPLLAVAAMAAPRIESLPAVALPARSVPRRPRRRWAWRLGLPVLALLVPLAIADVPWVAAPDRPSVTTSTGNVSLNDARSLSRCAGVSMTPRCSASTIRSSWKHGAVRTSRPGQWIRPPSHGSGQTNSAGPRIGNGSARAIRHPASSHTGPSRSLRASPGWPGRAGARSRWSSIA